MNLYTVTKYAREILRAGEGQMVVIRRDRLRALTAAAETAPRYHKDRLICRTLGELPK